MANTRRLGAALLVALLFCAASVKAHPQAGFPGGPGALGGPPGIGAPGNAPPDGSPFPFLEPLPPDAPKPSSDPHDLEGTWFHATMMELVVTKTMYGKAVPLNDKGKALMAERLAAQKAGKPFQNAALLCLPPGPFWQIDINFPFTVLQTPEEIDFVFREFHGVWKIRMDRQHLPSERREYMGDSVGHWEGDTLVVDTTHFKDIFWVDSDVTGAPISRDSRLTYRIRKINEEDGPALNIVTTINDPIYSATAWSVSRNFIWRPDKAVFDEYNCEAEAGSPDGIAFYGYADQTGTKNAP